MKKQFAALAWAAAVAMTLLAGCSDSSPVASDNMSGNNTISESDPYSALTIRRESLEDFSEVPTFDEVLAKQTPGVPPTWSHFGALNVVSYMRIIQQLNLSREQDAQVRTCFMSYRDCAQEASRSHASLRRMSADSLRMAMYAIRDSLRTSSTSGGLTREEANARIRALVEAYTANVRAQQAMFMQAVESCKRGFEECVVSYLTPEQRMMWDRLKGNPAPGGSARG